MCDDYASKEYKLGVAVGVFCTGGGDAGGKLKRMVQISGTGAETKETDCET